MRTDQWLRSCFGLHLLSCFGLVVFSLATPLCGQFVYGINGSGIVSGYSVGVTGALTPIATSVPGGGYAAVEPSGKFLYFVQGSSASILGYAINPATGALTPIPGSPFPANVTAAVAVDPTGKFFYSFAFEGDEVGVAGFTVAGFTIDASTGALAPIAGSPFAPASETPVAIVADPQGRFLYEFTGAGISAFTINSSTGALTLVSGSPFAGIGEATIGFTVDPRGRFAYETGFIFPEFGFSNGVQVEFPGYTIIQWFAIDGNTGALAAVAAGSVESALGQFVNSITINPSGRFAYTPSVSTVSNNDAPFVVTPPVDLDGAITTYAIDPDTGGLTALPSPVANANVLYVDPTDRFAYATASSGTNVNSTIPYSIDPTTGMLTELPSGICCSGILIVAIAPNTVPLPVSVTPSSGSGASQVFSFEYSDTNGYTHLSLAYAGFGKTAYGDEKTCRVEYVRATNALYLKNDAGTVFLGPVTPGGVGTLSNSQCSVSAGASSVSGSGNILTLKLALSFTPAFAGTQGIFMYADDRNGQTTPGRQQRGTWIVP
jgi:6-phosphogluconolactonase (cycloisomerase 2 family)